MRARTARFAVVVRDTTLRVVARELELVERVVTPRVDVARDGAMLARDDVARDGATFVAVRATVRFDTLFRGLVRPAARDTLLPARGD